MRGENDHHIMPFVRLWIADGCKPEHQHAYDVATLDDLERDGLIIRVEAFGDLRPTWVMTALGNYCADFHEAKG